MQLRLSGRKEAEIMPEVIIDASLVVKWFSVDQEEYLNEALEVLGFTKERKIRAFAPVFLIIEVINILFKKKKLAASKIRSIIERLRDSGIDFVEFNLGDLEKLINMAARYKTTSYDALYLLLAKEKKCKLLPFDEELLGIETLTIGVEKVLSRVKNDRI